MKYYITQRPVSLGTFPGGHKVKEIFNYIAKALLVYDSGIEKAGIADKVAASLKEAGIEVVPFNKVLADPPDYIVNEGAQLGLDQHVDGIVTVGGGSSLDTGKAINILLSNPLPIGQYYSFEAPAGTHPLIAIPTTAGTGSEVTQGGMITDTSCNIKKFVPGFATMAIIDPELYMGMPVQPSTYCGFDAFCHAVEAIISPFTDPTTTMFAKEAVSLMFHNIPKLQTESSNIAVREQLATGTTFAGWAVCRVPCHLSHAIGHSVGAAIHIPHGLACVSALPQLVKRYAYWMPEQTKIVAKAMDLPMTDAMTEDELSDLMYTTLSEMMKTCKVPTFKELGYSEEEILAIAPTVMQDITMNYAPKQLTQADIEEIMKEAYNA